MGEMFWLFRMGRAANTTANVTAELLVFRWLTKWNSTLTKFCFWNLLITNETGGRILQNKPYFSGNEPNNMTGDITWCLILSQNWYLLKVKKISCYAHKAGCFSKFLMSTPFFFYMSPPWIHTGFHCFTEITEIFQDYSETQKGGL